MHTPGKISIMEDRDLVTTRGKTIAEVLDTAEGLEGDDPEADANAARLVLEWNLLEAGIVELLLSSCDEFMQVNAKHEYEFESNEPRVYRQMHEAIVKARSILSQLSKELRVGSKWKPITSDEPVKGVVVDTKIDDDNGPRNEQPLSRGGANGRLWFFPDNSMYVYYTPTHWRPLATKGT